MALYDEVFKIQHRLENMISSNTADHASALDLLNELKKRKINLDVLQKTGIGKTVNSFRKATKNDEVISLSKSLIKSWKKLIGDGQKNDTNNKHNKDNKIIRSDLINQEMRRNDSIGSNLSEDNRSQSSPDMPNKDSPGTPMIRSYPQRVSQTSDPVRLKCREMLVSALKCGELPSGANDPVDVAAAIEEQIFLEFNDTGNKYKNRLRSRVLNLRDGKNPKLREDVLLGYISAERIAVMSSEEMASKEVKELRDKFTKESIDDHQMAVRGGTNTSLLKCGKCGKREVTYNQVQTRSADEPMTTFCLCNSCGNRWKFC